MSALGIIIAEGRLGAQSVKGLTLDFCSGRGLGVLRWIPASGSMLSAESSWDSLPLLLPPLALSLSQKINK